MTKVLIVEDEESMRVLMQVKLKKDYDIYTVENGKEALKLLENIRIDLILVDVMMPVMNGYELMKELRDSGNEIPAIMITAKSTTSDKLKGFDSGIDDYMTKPIDFDELRARMRVLLRRSRINKEKYIEIGNIVINSETYSIKNNKDIQYLPKKEFEILYKLLAYPEIIFTKDQLLEQIWGYYSESDETTIRTHINRLRSKIEQYSDFFEIQTIRGLGYKGIIKGD